MSRKLTPALAHVVAVDTDQSSGRQPSAIGAVKASTLAGTKAPPRKFVVEGLMPSRTVTAFSGDGGVGKSLLSLVIAVSVARGSRSWFGLSIEPGPVVFLTAEDELDEVHRRLEAVCEADDLDIALLEDLHIVPLAGKDALLAIPDRDRGIMKETPLFGSVRRLISEVRPRLVFLDTLADIFGGSENDRAQARSFIGMLRGLCLEFDTAIVILSHPSLSGLASKSGSSGSTGWTNSVRSRIYLERPTSSRRSAVDDEDEFPVDPDARILSVKKSNYAATDLTLRLRWSDGTFVTDDGDDIGESSQRRSTNLPREEAEAAADDLFIRLLVLFTSQDRTVSPSPSANYAATVFAKHPEAKGFGKRALAAAMDRLLDNGRIHIKVSGPSSRRRRGLAVGPASSGPMGGAA